MRRALLTGIVVASALLVAMGAYAIGRHPWSTSSAVATVVPATTTEPPTTTTTEPPTTTTTSVCDLNAPTDGCPPGTPAAIAWAQQQDQAAQAAQAAAQAAAAQQAEQAYAQCLTNNAQAITDQILQTFGQVPGTGTPTYETCSTAGLTPAEIQQVQQAEGPQPSTQPSG